MNKKRLFIVWICIILYTLQAKSQNPSSTTTLPGGSVLCTGDIITVDFVLTNIADPNLETYAIILSDPSGNFSSGTTTLSGSLQAFNGLIGQYTGVLIPTSISTAYSDDYKIQVEITSQSNAVYFSVDITEFYGTPVNLTTITGPITALCATITYTYSVNSDLSITSYNWTIPSGTAINGVSTENSIVLEIQPGFTGGILSVEGINCGGGQNHTSNTQSISLSLLPAVGAFNPGPIDICPEYSYDYTTPAVTGIPTGTTVQYVWTAPSTALITSNSNQTPSNPHTTTDNTVSIEFPITVSPGNVEVEHSFISTCGTVTGNNNSLTLNILTPPTVSITPPGPFNICPADDELLTATNIAGATYQWNLNGSPIPGATNDTYSASDAGNYTVTVTENGNCTATSTNSIDIFHLSSPPVTPPSVGPIISCGGVHVLLDIIPGFTGYSYQWYVGTTPIAAPEGIAEDYTATISGNYHAAITATGYTCTTYTDESEVIISPIINVNPGSDFVYTNPNNTPMGGGPTGQGGILPLTYLWAPNTGLDDETAANPNISGLQNTTPYTVTVTDAVFCTASATVTVTVYRTKINTVNARWSEFEIDAPGVTNLPLQESGTPGSIVDFIPTPIPGTIEIDVQQDPANGINEGVIRFEYGTDLVINPSTVEFSYDGISFFPMNDDYFQIVDQREIRFTKDITPENLMQFDIANMDGVVFDPLDNTSALVDFVIDPASPGFITSSTLEIIQVSPPGYTYNGPGLIWPISTLQQGVPLSGLYKFTATINGMDGTNPVTMDLHGQFIIE